MNRCLDCFKECTLKCSTCKVSYFCNKDCQKSAWKNHKAFCKSVSNPRVSPCPNGPMQTCVIVDGFGPCGSGWDDMIKARDRLLLSGMNVVHIDGGKGGPNRSLQVASLLESEKKPNAIIFFGFGSGGDGSDGYFYSPHMGRYFRKALKSWCAAGGRFIVQGERIAYTGRWPSWFGKSWIDGDYFRTDHKCFAVGSDATNWCEWYKNSQGAMLSTYNVKACMLKNVDPTEVLFGSVENARSYSLVEGFGGQEIGEGSTAVAFAQFESGTVSFFGDVNHEDKTIQIMAVIACGQQKCR